MKNEGQGIEAARTSLPIRNLSPNVADTVLRSMQLSADDGSFDTLALMIAHLGESIEALQDRHQIDRLIDLKRILESAQSKEKLYGVGCLLNLHCSSVQRKIARGWISKSQIRNAENYTNCVVKDGD